MLHKVSAAPGDSPTSTLEETRERVLDRVKVAFAVVGGVTCALVVWRLLALAPQVGAGAIQALANRIPFAGEIIKSSGVTFTGTRAAPAVAFFGGGLLFWQARGLVRWVADHLFPPFDTDLLRPIRKAGALDPLWLPPLGTDRGMQPLPWVAPPRDSPRHAVWAALIAFLSANVGEGRFDLFGHPRTPFVPFRWTMLTGRPGAGKTRIATEIARARARRELLDRNDEETRAERRRLARGAWLRSAWPFARRHETAVPGARDDAPWHDADPWDAGWIVAGSGQGGLARWQNSRFDDGLLARLKAWRPRRPTVLVLDDPRSGDASRVIGALLDGERRYRHPVRLIVVSQTLPQDLVFRSQHDGSWSAGPRGFAGPVLALGAGAPLSAGEVRRMFGALQLSGHVSGWKPNDANVRRLLLRSRGNALLVCLALQQIQRRHDAKLVPADELLLDRAQRIVEGLEVAGLGAAEQLRAIAWATLACGSASAFELPAEPSPGDWPRFEPEALGAVPNLGAAWPGTAAPPLVRPEPIGDAFVRLVLSERLCDAATRRRVIVAAWQANPTAMLAAVQRLGQDKPGQGGDALAAALRTGPPDEAALDPVDVALAYCVAAVRIPRPEWDAGEIPRLGPALAVALRHIRRLPSGRAAAAFARLVTLLEVPNSEAVLRGRAVLLCIGMAIHRMLGDEEVWSAPETAGAARAQLTRFFELLPRWGTDPYRDRRSRLAKDLDVLIRRIMPAAGDPAMDGWAVDLAGTAWRAGYTAPGSVASVLSACGRSLAERGDAAPLMAARAHCFATMAAAVLGDTGRAERAANAVDTAVCAFAGDREFELERVQAWRSVAYAHQSDAVACEQAARHVDDLARPFAGDREFERERAIVYGYLGTAPDLWRSIGQIPRV